MRAIGYVRVSTAGQVEDGVSLDAQEAKVRAWAEANDAAGVLIFRDAGISGKRSDNRPGLQEALAEVKKGDALVCYSLSRLSRSTRDTLSISDELQRKGGDLVSTSEKIDTTTAAGNMVFQVLAVLAEFERKQIGDRTRMALQYKKSKGEKTGGDVPFGYRVQAGRLHKDDQEQLGVSMIYTLKAKGERISAICRALEAAGIPRKGGIKTWHHQTVRNIISRRLTA